MTVDPAAGMVASPPKRKGVWLSFAGAFMAAWAMLPRYRGPDLATADRVEIVDHVVPGAVVLVMAVAALILNLGARRALRAHAPTLLFVAGLVIVLSGMWMTATHVPLLAQAARGDVTWGAATFHTAPGIAVLVLGVVWSATYWSLAGTAPAASGEPGEAAGPKGCRLRFRRRRGVRLLTLRHIWHSPARQAAKTSSVAIAYNTVAVPAP